MVSVIFYDIAVLVFDVYQPLEAVVFKKINPGPGVVNAAYPRERVIGITGHFRALRVQAHFVYIARPAQRNGGLPGNLMLVIRPAITVREPFKRIAGDRPCYA